MHATTPWRRPVAYKTILLQVTTNSTILDHVWNVYFKTVNLDGKTYCSRVTNPSYEPGISSPDQEPG